MAKRFNLSFKETEEEIKLKKFFEEECKIIGQSAYIKMLLKKEMDKQEASKTPSCK